MVTSIPLCFYPLQKIILDDDQAFAQSVLLKMHGYHFTAFHSPREALNYLLHEYRPEFTKTDLIALDNTAENTSTQQVINIDIKKLKKMLAKQQHNDINVLLIDFHMPEMCGLDFLKEITHLPIKKALITGESDYKIAVDAFNQGLVDTYIRKDEADFLEKIQAATFDLEWRYFAELSNFMTDLPDFNYLRNNHFIEIFRKFIYENNIIAFCLVDIQGNFLTLDKQGNYKYILVRNKAQLHELAIIAKEDGASLGVITQLEQGNVIPFFGDKNFWQVPAKEWDSYLHPANIINNESTLVWAAITEIGTKI